MDSEKIVSFNYDRRYGVEMELNSFDLRDFRDFPLGKSENPLGMEEIANLVRESTGNSVAIKAYSHTHGNTEWVIKPDSSCGMELCSPVSKGWTGLKSICEVSDVLNKDKRVQADNRCSLHVHVEVADCSRTQVAKILAYWVKAESIFMDSVPIHRKKNSYCQCIGMSDLFEHNTLFNEDDIIAKLGNKKYYSINCYHHYRGERKTVEFRIGEAEACLNPFLVKNWVRLVVHFVEQTKNKPIPEPYAPGNPWTGWCWLDPNHFFELMDFSGSKLSPGMEQTRNWFLARLYKNISKEGDLQGVFSGKGRKIALDQTLDLMRQASISPDDVDVILRPTNPDLIYSTDFKA